jgi:hypothetical protein
MSLVLVDAMRARYRPLETAPDSRVQRLQSRAVASIPGAHSISVLPEQTRSVAVFTCTACTEVENAHNGMAALRGLYSAANVMMVQIVGFSVTSVVSSAPTPKEIVNNPILEMRPANRSLAEKAREELSEFERDYPW